MTSPSIKIDGLPFKLGKSIGKGGEGEIFAFDGHADIAVKIYHHEKRATRELKVRAMVSDELADKTRLVAFPTAIATDGRDCFIGFLMRLFSGYRPIHELYSPKSRKAHFPKADYRFLVRAALNVASAVVKVHQAGCVIGDFNHSGVLVSQEATISLIDADSFQYSRAGKLFPCVVGVPDFTPPELHGADLSAVCRTEAHDNFGLAVAVFHLLAMGKHPYAGRFAGGDISMSDAIAQHRFAFSQDRAGETRTTPPPASVSLKDFPPQIAAAFEAAFGRDPAKRPNAATWATLMKDFEKALSHCGRVRTHYYPSATSGCVWCRVASQSAVDMFPDLQEPALQPTDGGSFDIARITAQFEAIRLPDPALLLPKPSGLVNAASAAVGAAKRMRIALHMLVAVAALVAITGFLAAPSLAMVWIGVSIVGVVILLINWFMRASYKSAYKTANAQVQSLQQGFVERLGIAELLAVRVDVENWLRSYRDLDRVLAQNLQNLQASRESRKREEFLDRFLIRNARIAGIGPARTAILASYGIETAADIQPIAVRNVPEFGEALIAKLLAWRKLHEDRFIYSTVTDAADIQAENAVRANSAAKRMELQNKLHSALAALQTGMQQVAARARLGDPVLMEALSKRAQAAHDMKLLGMSVAAPGAFALPQKQTAFISRRAVNMRRNTGSPNSAAPNCPLCGSHMQNRVGRTGRLAGRRYWACSRSPTCHGTRN